MRRSSLAALVVVAPALSFGASTAEACGGFFCSQSQPVLQSGENVVFVDHGNGDVTAVVQISYTGPAEAFSWLVPVPGIPDIGVSSNIAMQRLLNSTRPQFRLRDVGCIPQPPPSNGLDAGGLSGDAGPGFDAGTSVIVVASGSTGPFDFEVLQRADGPSGSNEAVLQWLVDNNYDVTGVGPELLGSYLDAGMNFVGFKLQKERMVGEIRPVTMRYQAENPMLPIRLTQVATVEDLDLTVFLVGPSRAVSLNYPDMELNYAMLHWPSRGGNYRTLVTAAANEAGGRAFVTELAERSNQFTVFSTQEDQNWRRLAMQDWRGDEIGMLRELLQSYGRWDGVREVLADHVPLPAERTVNDLFRNFFSVWGERTGPIEGFDSVAFLPLFEEAVIQPMRTTQQLITEQPYITRFYSTISGNEMTVDPVFSFNPDLPNVSRMHDAERNFDCGGSGEWNDKPYTVTLENGDVVHGRGFGWSVPVAEQNANRRVVQYDAEGQGTEVLNNEPVELPTSPPPERTVNLGNDLERDATCSCDTTANEPWSAALGFLVLALFGLRRRR